MNNKKDIEQHLDLLMKSAEQADRISTNPGFEAKLNARLDAIDASAPRVKASIFSLNNLQKYAALFLLLILNVSVILIFSSFDETDTDTPQTAQEYSDEYFPDYTLLTSLE